MRANNPIAKPITLKDERRQTLKYVIADCCASALAWMAFLFYPTLFYSTDLMGQLTLFCLSIAQDGDSCITCQASTTKPFSNHDSQSG